MGRAGGRAGEGVSPLHTANGFSGLQQASLSSNGSMVKQSFPGIPSPSSSLQQLGYDTAAGQSVPNIGDISSFLPLAGTNGMNDLLMQYRKAQHDQQHTITNQASSAFHRPQPSASNPAAQLQSQLFTVARNGQIAEHLSHMMNSQQVMLAGAAGAGVLGNGFDAAQPPSNGQTHAPRLNGTAHPLQVTFDLATQQQQQQLLNSPASHSIAGFAPELAAATQAHQSAATHPLQGPAQRNGFPFAQAEQVAMHGGGGGQQAAEPAADSSGVESAEEASAGKGDRKEARKEYHKRIERKRRDRMRNLYDELRSLVNPDEPADKNSVLAGAVSLIQELRDENIKLQSRVHIKEKRAKMMSERGKGAENLQIKVFKSKDKELEEHGGKRAKDDKKSEGCNKDDAGADGRLAEEGSGPSTAMVEELKKQSAAADDKPEQERNSGEETSEGSEQGATSKTSDSVAEGGDGMEQGNPKRQRVDDGEGDGEGDGDGEGESNSNGSRDGDNGVDEGETA